MMVRALVTSSSQPWPQTKHHALSESSAHFLLKDLRTEDFHRCRLKVKGHRDGRRKKHREKPENRRGSGPQMKPL